MHKEEENIQFLYIDLFCGAGGTTTGVEMATDEHGRRIAKVIIGINHDENAIRSQCENHPDATHYIEDIRVIEMQKIVNVLNIWKGIHPNAKVVLWASLECTNFSNAKGGKPKDADSRTLAWHLKRYIRAINPDLVQIENVREFMAWGDLDEHGKPISRTAGKQYIRWTNSIKDMGYSFNQDMLNAADFGAYTSRNRLFIQFGKKDMPVTFPEPTHSKKPHKDAFGERKPHKPVREVLHLNDHGESIFNRKKPLAENTLKRIYSGLVKYSGKEHKYQFLVEYYGNGFAQPIDKPIGTLTTKDRHIKVTCQFFHKNFSTGGVHAPIDKPAGSILPNDKHNLVTCTQFLDKTYSGKENHSPLNKPCGTILSNDKHYLVTAFDGLSHLKINKDDSRYTKRIKGFMIRNGISDICTRLLHIPELLKIQGFPEDYHLVGTKTEKKKYIGNSVHPTVAMHLVTNLYNTLKQSA